MGEEGETSLIYGLELQVCTVLLSVLLGEGCCGVGLGGIRILLQGAGLELVLIIFNIFFIRNPYLEKEQPTAL